MDARRGGSYGYATGKGSHVVNGVSEFECHGDILEFDPPRLLVYTWVANWHLDKQRKTVVRWELTPAGAGTHVKVTHSGLANEAVAREDYRGGWPGSGGKTERVRGEIERRISSENESRRHPWQRPQSLPTRTQ